MVERRRGGRSTAGRNGGDAGGGGKGGDVPNLDKRKGEKGAGKGKDDTRKGAVKGNGKGKGKSEGKSASWPQPQERVVSNVKTVQEIEAEMKSATGSTKERREAAKQPLEAKGQFCEVKKHSEMGCAVVSFLDQESQAAVMTLAEKKRSSTDKDGKSRPVVQISGVDVQLRPHIDKAKGDDDNVIKTDIFVAWGRQAEKQSNLPASFIAEAIDLLLIECRGGYLTPQAPLSPMVAPQQQPMLASLQHMVPGPQQQAQQQFQAMNAMLWAAAAAQQAAQMQVAPASPQPPETPPRSLAGGQMRADAQAFTPPPVSQQQNFLDQYANYNELDINGPYADWNQAYGQPTKRFEIVDPNSGEKVSAPAKSNLSQGAPVFEPQFPASRKPVKIVDPNTNEQVDTLGMLWEKPKPSKTFAIKDPTSGSLISA